jgi:hypothetical protein
MSHSVCFLLFISYGFHFLGILDFRLWITFLISYHILVWTNSAFWWDPRPHTFCVNILSHSETQTRDAIYLVSPSSKNFDRHVAEKSTWHLATAHKQDETARSKIHHPRLPRISLTKCIFFSIFRFLVTSFHLRILTYIYLSLSLPLSHLPSLFISISKNCFSDFPFILSLCRTTNLTNCLLRQLCKRSRWIAIDTNLTSCGSCIMSS